MKQKLESKNTNTLKKQVPKEYEQIYNLISNNPIHINDICKISNQTISQITPILTMLELEEFIEQLPGNQFKVKEN